MTLRPMTALALAALAGAATAGSPDLVIGDMSGVSKWTPTPGPGNVQAYSFGISTCNIGDENAAWNSNAQHPAFGQNLHRIANGRIEQIGMSLAWHGVSAISQNLCGTCNPSGDITLLGPGCSSPNSSSSLGSQAFLAPRSGVNASTGVLTWPLPGNACGGDPTAICERLQVAEADLSVPNAIYIGETVVVQFQDAAGGATANNASWRRFAVNPAFNLAAQGALSQGSAVEAWKALNHNGAPDAGILVTEVVVPGDGVLHVGSDAEPIGNGRWRYTIVVENISSDRAVGELTLSMGADPNPMGFTFHDADYHSGEIYDNAEWVLLLGDASFRWRSPATFAQNPNTNAIRWGTLYTFSFTSVAGPVNGLVGLTLFKPGTPQGIGAAAIVPGFELTYCPGDVNNDGIVNFHDLNVMLGTYGQQGVDLNADVDADGEIGFPDLNLLLGMFGQSC